MPATPSAAAAAPEPIWAPGMCNCIPVANISRPTNTVMAPNMWVWSPMTRKISPLQGLVRRKTRPRKARWKIGPIGPRKSERALALAHCWALFCPHNAQSFYIFHWKLVHQAKRFACHGNRVIWKNPVNFRVQLATRWSVGHDFFWYSAWAA